MYHDKTMKVPKRRNTNFDMSRLVTCIKLGADGQMIILTEKIWKDEFCILDLSKLLFQHLSHCVFSYAMLLNDDVCEPGTETDDLLLWKLGRTGFV